MNERYKQEGLPQGKSSINVNELEDFPGGPVVRTLCFHCRGTGWGIKIIQVKPHDAAKKIVLRQMGNHQEKI